MYLARLSHRIVWSAEYRLLSWTRLRMIPTTISPLARVLARCVMIYPLLLIHRTNAVCDAILL